MASAFFLKQRDTSPALQYTVKDEDGSAIDLSGATVTFYMQDETGTTVIDGGSVTLVDAANGIVKYEWQDGDSDNAGYFKAEFLVTFGDGTKRTSPDPGWISIVVSGSVRGS